MTAVQPAGVQQQSKASSTSWCMASRVMLHTCFVLMRVRISCLMWELGSHAAVARYQGSKSRI
jgi:hypothetical protein